MNVGIRFGALSPSLHVQLGVEASDLELEQRLADAITLCQIHSVITQSEKDKAHKRLFKRILARYKEILEASDGEKTEG